MQLKVLLHFLEQHFYFQRFLNKGNFFDCLKGN